MDFEITLKLNDYVTYVFNNEEFKAYDAEKDGPITINGDIIVDGNAIGNLKGYQLYSDANLCMLCDEISGDCEKIAATICDKTGAVSKKYLSDATGFDRIFILDKIEINENFRNKGIGSAIIKKLPKMLQYQFDFDSSIFLCAGDFESAKKYGFKSEEYKKGSKRLVEFYKRCGYKMIKNNVMVCNISEE